MPGQNPDAFRRLTSLLNNIFPGSNAFLYSNLVTVRFRKFNHHDRISAIRQGRPGHDGNSFSRGHSARKVPAGANFAPLAQYDGRRGNIRGADRKSIANGAMKRRVVAICSHIMSQDAAAGPTQRHPFNRGAEVRRRQFLFCNLQRLLEGNHCTAVRRRGHEISFTLVS